MTREKLNAILAGLRVGHFKSLVIGCDLPGARKSVADGLTDVVTSGPYNRTQVVDTSLIPDLKTWKQTIRDAPYSGGYLLIIDSNDVLASWSEENRRAAWRFLAKVAFCTGVIVVSSAYPKVEDDFRRVGDVDEMEAEFDRIPYYMPALDDGGELRRLKVATLGD